LQEVQLDEMETAKMSAPSNKSATSTNSVNNSGNGEETAGWESDDSGGDGVSDGDGDGDRSNDSKDEDVNKTLETIIFPVSLSWMETFINLPVNQDDDDNSSKKSRSRIGDMHAGLARIAPAEGRQAIASGAPPPTRPSSAASSAAANTPEPKEKGGVKQGKKKPIKKVLQENGYTLKREKKHYILTRIVKNKDGSHKKQTVTRSKTPRNQGNADKSTLGDIRRQNRELADENEEAENDSTSSFTTPSSNTTSAKARKKAAAAEKKIEKILKAEKKTPKAQAEERDLERKATDLRLIADAAAERSARDRIRGVEAARKETYTADLYLRDLADRREQEEKGKELQKAEHDHTTVVEQLRKTQTAWETEERVRLNKEHASRVVKYQGMDIRKRQKCMTEKSKGDQKVKGILQDPRIVGRPVAKIAEITASLIDAVEKEVLAMQAKLTADDDLQKLADERVRVADLATFEAALQVRTEGMKLLIQKQDAILTEKQNDCTL
jgi:hypothetical protein